MENVLLSHFLYLGVWGVGCHVVDDIAIPVLTDNAEDFFVSIGYPPISVALIDIFDNLFVSHHAISMPCLSDTIRQTVKDCFEEIAEPMAGVGTTVESKPTGFIFPY